jgi:aconitate decarboxylase
MPYVNRPSPETGLSGKFSFQYTLASALLDGKVGIHTFSGERLHAPDMQALLPKIEIVMDKDIPARFETMHVRLRIELTDGSVLETRCDGPRGMWGQPKIASADHLLKVRDCLATALAPEAAEQCIALASRIDTLEPHEIGTLIQLIG